MRISVGFVDIAHVCAGFWNGHDAPQAQARQLRDRLRQSQRFAGRNTGLGGATIDIDLQANVQRREILRALFAQTLGDFQAVYRLHPIKMRGDQAGLVALNRTNAVPLEGQVCKRRYFFDRFLDVVFTKRGLACGEGLCHLLRPKSFGHSQQANRIRVADCRGARLAYAFLNLLQMGGNGACVGHADEDNAKKGSAAVDIAQLLRLCVDSHASDLHLSAGLPPMLRVHGQLRRTDLPALSDQAIRALLEATMSPAQRQMFVTQWELDFACEGPHASRFRVNAFTQLHGTGAVFRSIPSHVWTLEQLGAPGIFSQLALKPQGLVLVTGPTGSGKSTTLAALVQHRNTHHGGHIVTIEDPIEFVHVPHQGLVHQREVGTHTQGFAQALRSALREDPDAIVIGELRDLETIRLALTAAETGHLVLASVHTASAAKTIDRIVDVFPGDERSMVRTMLSESLLAVISQTLCTTPNEDGRLAAFEILVGTPAVRNLIREGKIAQLYSAMQTGSGAGMQTLDHHLMALLRAQRISLEQARSNAKMPENFSLTT